MITCIARVSKKIRRPNPIEIRHFITKKSGHICSKIKSCISEIRYFTSEGMAENLINKNE